MKKSYCVICGKEKRGIAVQDDLILDSIRWFKRNVTKNEKGNRLVVCKEDYGAYKAARKKYVGRQRIYLALGVLFVMLTILVYPSIAAVVTSVVVFAFIVLLSLLSYMPRISIKTA